MGVKRKPSRRSVTSKSPSKANTENLQPTSTNSLVAKEKRAGPTSTRFVPDGIPIVGIGASAGGWEALVVFFRHMPVDSGMAFVVVSHQPTGRTSLLPSLLRPCTGMQLHEAADGMQVEPNHVYLAQAGKN